MCIIPILLSSLVVIFLFILLIGKFLSPLGLKPGSKFSIFAIDKKNHLMECEEILQAIPPWSYRSYLFL